MEYLFGTVIFLFGAALGSFVAVISDRHNTGLSFLKGRSFCFSCNAELQKKDLIPVFSFILLKGKCRYCSGNIPKKSFMVEIIMGILSVLVAFKSGFFGFDFPVIHNSYFLVANFIPYLLTTFIFADILLIAVYDLKHFIIPDSFLISLFILSITYNLFFTGSHSLVSLLLSGVALSLPFLLIFLISRGTWLGFGDVKYILILGFFLGFAEGLSAVILAFWIGALFSLSVLLIKKLQINLPILSNNLTIKSEVPFGPFLSIGILISFYLNADIFQIHSLFNL